jgi:hypothetical protein
MAGNPALSGGVQIGQVRELKQRLLFLVLALIVYRIGTFIPVPGVNPGALAALFQQQQGTLDMFNMFSGGALERASLLSGNHAVYFRVHHRSIDELGHPQARAAEERRCGAPKIKPYTRGL